MNHQRGGLRAPTMGTNAAVLAEALRAAANAPESASGDGPGEARFPAAWRLFGGTLLSIVALVVITLCQQFSTGLGDLRKDVLHLSQAQGELVKAEDCNSRLRSLWQHIKELEAERATLVALKEKSATLTERLGAAEQECKALAREIRAVRGAEVATGETERLARELKRLREQLAPTDDHSHVCIPAAHPRHDP